jgi:hypothetical protein
VCLRDVIQANISIFHFIININLYVYKICTRRTPLHFGFFISLSIFFSNSNSSPISGLQGKK